MVKQKQVGHTPARRGGGIPWTTPEQAAWLALQMSDYRAAQANNGITAFLLSTTETFLEQWPLQAASAPEPGSESTEGDPLKRLKKQIRMWYNNHSRSKHSRTELLLELSATRKKKRLAAYQAYQSLYRQKVMSAVESEWSDAWRANPERDQSRGDDLPPVPIDFRNKVAKWLLDEESDEIKAEVEEFQMENAEKNDNNDPDTEQDTATRQHANAKAYQENIEKVGTTALQLLETIRERAGMVGSFVCAGPEPEQGGNIMVLSVHSGRTAGLGIDFGKSFPEWKSVVEPAMIDFASRVFPPEIRAQRALPGTEDLQKLYTNNVRSGTPSTNAAFSRAGSPPRHQPTRADQSTSKTNQTTSTAADSANDKDDDNDGDDGNPGGVTQPVNEYLREREENITRRKQLEQELHDEWTSLGNEFATTKRAGLSHKNQRPNARAASSDSVQHALGQSISLTTSGKTTSGKTTPGNTIDETSQTVANGPPIPRDDPSSPVVSDPRQIAISEAIPDLSDQTSQTATPPWLQTGVTNLLNVAGGAPWKELVEKLPIFDRLLGFPSGRGPSVTLAAKGRPDLLSNWIQCRRKYEAQPSVTDISTYSTVWWSWWASLQPASRKGDQGCNELKKIATDADDWSDLRKGSVNGFFGLVLALSWWVDAAKAEGEREAVGKAVDDVLWALDQMIANRPSERKRTANNDDGPARKRGRPA